MTALILDLIAENGRIVNLSSGAHKAGTLNFSNFMFENGGYNAFVSYSRSKLCNLLFTFELGSRLKAAHSSIIVTACHPGVAKTGLFDTGKRPRYIQFFINLYLNSVSSAQDGAKPTIMAALDPSAQTGYYYGPAKVKGEVRLESPIKAALDKNKQEKLWAYSLEKTGVTYSI